MSKQNIPAEELDDFFRKSAEDFKIDFNPEAWEKMEKKLDAPSSGNGTLKKMFPLILAVILLTATLIVISTTTDGDKKGLREMKNREVSLPGEPLHDDNQVKGSNEDVGSMTGGSISFIEDSSDVKNNADSEHDIKMKPKQRIIVKTEEHPIKEEESVISVNGIGQSPGKAKVGSAKKMEVAFVEGENKVSANSIQEKGYSKNQEGAAAVEEERVEQVDYLEMLGPNLSLLNGNPLIISEIKEDLQPLSDLKTVIKPKSGKNTVDRWSVGLQISPDLTGAGITGFSTIGNNAGINLEYYITRNWSITAGFLYSLKIYFASGDAYTMSDEIDYYGQSPDKIDGSCDILDIPLNVRYYFNSDSKGVVFLSAGLSSYFMLKENYDFLWNGKPKWQKSLEVKRENNHLFAITNLSIGYERRLSHRISGQAEPFMKLPLAGVGVGKVKLLSTGFFFTLKYNF